MNQEYTPGPCTLEPTSGGEMGSKYSLKSGILWLGHFYFDDISQGVDYEANARLIAAAPELLEAATAFCRNGWDGLPTCTYQDFEKLVKAIKKATGETQP